MIIGPHAFGYLKATSGTAESDLPVTSGLIGHYDASKLNASDGDSIDPWPDLSGNNNDLGLHPDTAGAPALVDPWNNQLPAVDFAGSTTAVLFATGMMGGVTNIEEASIFAVTETRQTGESKRWVVFGYPPDIPVWAYANDGSYRFNNGNLSLGSHPTVATLFTFVRKNDAYERYIDGALDGSGGSGVSDNRNFPDDFYLGDAGGASDTFPEQNNQIVAEVAVYNRQLSDSERQSVESHLISKWGL